MGSFNLKMISIKSVFINNLTFINPWNVLFGFNSQKICQYIECTGLLRWKKLLNFEAEKLALFTQHLV